MYSYTVINSQRMSRPEMELPNTSKLKFSTPGVATYSGVIHKIKSYCQLIYYGHKRPQEGL